LFVDGNADARSALLAALRGEGFHVQAASTGAQALLLSQQRPQLVILANALPDMTTEEVCRSLRSEAPTAAVPVVHLGATPNGAGDSETDHYLLEAVDPQLLLAQVRALLRLRQVEESLRTSRLLLRDLLDHAPVVVFVKDLQGRYLLVNRHWEARFHKPREEVVGRSAYDIYPAAQAEVLLANDRRVAEAGIPMEFDEEVRTANGVRIFLSEKFPLRDESGTCYAVCGISTDITERKKWEKALHDSEALYESLVETLPVSILRKDLHGCFTFANRAFCCELRRPLEEILGRTDFDFFPPALAHKYVADDRRVIATGEVFEDVEAHRSPDGAKSHVEVIKSPLRDSHGQVIGVQCVFWDVTARKEAEEELDRNAAEFRVARKIQQKLFPSTVPHIPALDISSTTFGFDIGGASYPAEAVGGDYYDYLPLLDGSLGVAIGDVSGHGIGPALLMAEARAYLRAFAQTQVEVAAILSLLNSVITEDSGGDWFITLLLARLDARARTLTYTSAGHPTGYIFDAVGKVKHTLPSLSIPLGVQRDIDFPASQPIPLDPGDTILFVTDGVVEARAPDGSSFGAERTQTLLRVYRHLCAAEIVDNLYYAVRAFAQNRPQYDDITATVVKVSPR
jgi:sigma-B regulation protein RsbU (phosphoserine phosphatase)